MMNQIGIGIAFSLVAYMVSHVLASLIVGVNL